MLYTSYLGGGFVTDGTGSVYMAGSTFSADFPSTDGSQVQSLPSAFAAKFDFAPGRLLQPSCVVDAASYAGGPVAPGKIVTIFNPGLGPQDPAYATLDSRGLLSNQLANTQVLFDGTPAPLLYVQANQINLIVPFAVAGKTDTHIQVVYNGQQTNTVDFPVAQSAPGIFNGSIVNQDGTLNGPASPGTVLPGSPALAGSIVSIFATGAGQINPAGGDGQIDSGTLASPVVPVSVFINDQQVPTQYIGQAPGQVDGVLQINALLPALVSRDADASMPVYLKAGGAVSNTVFVYVRPNAQ